MKRRCIALVVTVVCIVGLCTYVYGGDNMIAGVTFPAEKVVEGKVLKLNGVALLKKFGFVKVYAGGFYCEKPVSDAKDAIESEQIKQFHLHYLTSKATAEKLREGFIELITENNPPELVKAHAADIKTYTSWYDKDMAPGKTSVTTYVPGKGLTLEWQGEIRGTIPGSEFAHMYFRYIFGEKADDVMKKGFLGSSSK